jgi:hypothetical protein
MSTLFPKQLPAVQIGDTAAALPRAVVAGGSQLLTAMAHAGELTVVAGFNRPHVPFPDLVSDSVSCGEPLDKGIAARTIN